MFTFAAKYAQSRPSTYYIFSSALPCPVSLMLPFVSSPNYPPPSDGFYAGGSGALSSINFSPSQRGPPGYTYPLSSFCMYHISSEKVIPGDARVSSPLSSSFYPFLENTSAAPFPLYRTLIRIEQKSSKSRVLVGAIKLSIRTL